MDRDPHGRQPPGRLRRQRDCRPPPWCLELRPPCVPHGCACLCNQVRGLRLYHCSDSEGKQGGGEGSAGETDNLLRRSLGFRAIVELPIRLAVAAALTRNEPSWEFVAVGTAVVLTCLLSGSSLYISIENRTAAAARLVMGVNLVLQGASVMVAILTGSASAVWAVRTLVPAAALGLNFLLLDRDRRRIALRPRLPLKLGRAFWRFSLLSWASGLITFLVYSRSEIFLLQWFNKTEALGVFALAFGLAQVITAPADAMLHALLPAVAGVLSSWPERSLRAFDRSTRVSALLCGGIAAAVIPTLFFAVPLIYGRAFTSAAWLFIPLALVSVFQSLNNPVTAFVTGRERGRLILASASAALVVDVAIAVALIPQFGAWGAVAANVAGQMVGLILLAASEPLLTQRGLGSILRLYRAFLLGVVIGCAALGTGVALQSSSTFATTIVVGTLGGALYILAIRLTRSGLTIDDRNALVGVMARPAQAYLIQLLRPITTPGVV